VSPKSVKPATGTKRAGAIHTTVADVTSDCSNSHWP
jgi:hypothetical protein